MGKPGKRLPVRGGDRRPARVRPYSLTGGRTRFGHVLLVETFVGATAALEAAEERKELTNGNLASRVTPEMRAIVVLCRRMRTVAEIAALLRMPLGYFSRTYDLVLVSAGKGELVQMFARDAERSPYSEPQRALAVAYVHGLGPRPEHPDMEAVRCNLVPGVGEMFVMPTFTTSGRADILFWEGVPGGPLDAFEDVRDPAEHLSLTLEPMERFLPWEYARATEVELTDAGGTLAGRYAPTVRNPVGRLPSGGLVLGVADVVVADDPITGQGSNSASKCAAFYLASILEHGEEEFDEAWMQATFDRYWETARHVTKWTNAMLGPPPEHVLNLIGAAGQLQPVADRFANGFNDPADFENFFYDPKKTGGYLMEVSGASGA
ncbi:DUF742 domain-containing protein [Streptomyces pimonensis]|uniref:DUF742 domain-containing protein n=1 Tax=Streptomyces pimonensis TaxID=2860288 RepID=A0ABV4IT05_9ACTN